MARHRSTTSGLPSRVYEKHSAWYWVRPNDSKWIRLCHTNEGRIKMLERLAFVLKTQTPLLGTGDFPAHAQLFMKAFSSEKAETWRKEWERQGEVLRKAFRDWNVNQIDAGSVLEFLQTEWPEKLTTQRIYRAWLSSFFNWAVLKRLCSDNPCRFVKLKKPPPRDTYIPDQHFLAIRNALAVGRDGKPTPTGPMMQCFTDMCYLTAMRSTDVRNLKWMQIDQQSKSIRFQPSKTLKTSGGKVDWPITDAIEAVLKRASSISPDSDWVFHDEKGRVKTQSAIRQAWTDACARVNLEEFGYTIKDLRAKALTDAKQKGYSLDELSIAAVHADTRTTAIYLKGKKVPRSNVALELPQIDTA